MRWVKHVLKREDTETVREQLREYMLCGWAYVGCGKSNSVEVDD